jgi:hypothetical protein
MLPQPIRLVSPVTPENVASRIRLEIPRGNQNNVAVSDPNSSLEFAANSAQSFFAVLALHHDSVGTKQFNSNTQNVILGRQNHVFQAAFICDFSFSHFPTYPLNHLKFHIRKKGHRVPFLIRLFISISDYHDHSSI